MIWLLSNLRLMAGVLLIVVCAVMTNLAGLFHSRALRAEESLSSAEAITKNATAAINLMYDISKAANAGRQEQQHKGETHVVYIREAVKGDECAVRDVPVAAADNLRMYADSLRPGATAKDKR